MKKKLFSAFAAILVLVISIATLVACNPYKNTAIGGGDATAPVESNKAITFISSTDTSAQTQTLRGARQPNKASFAQK